MTLREQKLTSSLRDLLECFEPSVPTLFEGYLKGEKDPIFLQVPEEVEDIIQKCEDILNEEDEDGMEIEDEDLDSTIL